MCLHYSTLSDNQKRLSEYSMGVRTWRKNLVAVLIFQLLNLFFPPLANATVTQVIDATNSATPNCGSASTNSKYAIKFVAGTTASLSQVSVLYSANISSNSPSMKIYTDSAGLLGSEIGTLNFSAVQQINTRFSISYTGNISVTANGVYWLEQNQASTSVNASHCYENTSVVSTNSWNLSAGNSSQWRWRLPANPGFDYEHWSVDFYIGAVAPDTTAPTFTSSSTFSAAENIATSATAATIQVSESATVTISSGADAARFNITRTETNTAIIKFNASPDFEAPADIGGNNVYEITLTATDTAANAGTQSITITVTNVVDTSSFNSLSLAGSATTATFRTVVVITANVTVASRVTFRVNGIVLPGCKNKLTSGSGSSHSVTCNWRPSNRGTVALTAAATPTGAGISSTTSNPVSIMVDRRTGSR
jgi:hypothetical protein